MNVTADALTVDSIRLSTPAYTDTKQLLPRRPGHQKLVEKINQLKAETAAPGWDEGRGQPTRAEDWVLLEQIVCGVEKAKQSLEPRLSPEADGAVCARWTEPDGNDVLLEILADHKWLTHVNAEGVGATIEPLGSTDEIVAAVLGKLH